MSDSESISSMSSEEEEMQRSRNLGNKVLGDDQEEEMAKMPGEFSEDEDAESEEDDNAMSEGESSSSSSEAESSDSDENSSSDSDASDSKSNNEATKKKQEAKKKKKAEKLKKKDDKKSSGAARDNTRIAGAGAISELESRKRAKDLLADEVEEIELPHGANRDYEWLQAARHRSIFQFYKKSKLYSELKSEPVSKKMTQGKQLFYLDVADESLIDQLHGKSWNIEDLQKDFALTQAGSSQCHMVLLSRGDGEWKPKKLDKYFTLSKNNVHLEVPEVSKDMLRNITSSKSAPDSPSGSKKKKRNKPKNPQDASSVTTSKKQKKRKRKDGETGSKKRKTKST